MGVTPEIVTDIFKKKNDSIIWKLFSKHYELKSITNKVNLQAKSQKFDDLLLLF